MHTGQKIRLLRRLREMSQEELADKINKTRALVSHIEQSGKVNHYTLLAILKTFKISEDDLEQFKGNNLSQVAEPDGQKAYNKNAMAALKKQLLDCQKENKILNELVESQKRVIAMMGKKK